jgi:hypothetical protein
MKRKLYTTLIDKSDPEGQRIIVKPSKYLKKLHPEDVIAQLEAHIRSLKDKLIECSRHDIDVPKVRKRINKLGSELDVAKKYLAHFKNKYEAVH